MNQIKRILFIGDPHFKAENNDVTDTFISKTLSILEKEVKKCKDIICVLAGDILHTHERIHQVPFNKSIKYINAISKLCPLVVLIGNHDYINNHQFLTDNHWMNCLKGRESSGIYIADRVLEIQDFIFVPYVPPGRFIEALSTIEYDWMTAKCIFAHQEFKGSNLGSETTPRPSDHGDKWSLHYPLVVSGHIHKKHKPQPNINYPGSVVQHTFGEKNNDCGALLLDFSKDVKNPTENTISMDIPKMFSVEKNVDEIQDFILKASKELRPLQKMKIYCIGTPEENKSMKKKLKKLPSMITVEYKDRIKLNPEDETINYERYQTILDRALKEHGIEKLAFEVSRCNSILELVEAF